jgi:trehalose utilization protein
LHTPTYPVYHHPAVRRVIANAVEWAAQPGLAPYATFGTAVNSPTGWYAPL